ncbi:MAG TPA: small multi-drug export protein [Egibacteraceae bacterium]|nr:small multi-drug export protein [Egibacteraceae bacterium]
MELSFEAGGWWSYALVFLAAATPVLEVLVVVPAAILTGMAPVPVTVLAVAGNVTTLAMVVVAADRLSERWQASRGGPGRRAQRARQLARRWGVPGLAALGPVSTGSHIAALAAVAVGAGRMRVLGWMTGGVVAWGVTAAGAAVLGLGAT